MKIKGLTASVGMVGRVIARGDAIKRGEANEGGGGGASSRNSRDGFITEAVLAETGTNYPGCKCEQLGLRAGVRITDMISLGAGCTASADRWLTIGGQKFWVNTGGPGHVCERLSAVRRTYNR